MIISSGVSESSVRRRGGWGGRAPRRVSPVASIFDRFTECVESLIFSMAQITLLKIFYIFTFYLAECTTIFYLRVDPTTTLSLFFYKVQCFIPPVAGGPCYLYTIYILVCVQCAQARAPPRASRHRVTAPSGVWGARQCYY